MSHLVRCDIFYLFRNGCKHLCRAGAFFLLYVISVDK